MTVSGKFGKNPENYTFGNNCLQKGVVSFWTPLTKNHRLFVLYRLWKCQAAFRSIFFHRMIIEKTPELVDVPTSAPFSRSSPSIICPFRGTLVISSIVPLNVPFPNNHENHPELVNKRTLVSFSRASSPTTWPFRGNLTKIPKIILLATTVYRRESFLFEHPLTKNRRFFVLYSYKI